MLIEAAKGGHTNVVSLLIDYSPINTMDATGAEVVGDMTMPMDMVGQVAGALERFPGEGQSQVDVVEANQISGSTQQPSANNAQQPSTASTLPNKNR